MYANSPASEVLRPNHPESVGELVLFYTGPAYWGHQHVSGVLTLTSPAGATSTYVKPPVAAPALSFSFLRWLHFALSHMLGHSNTAMAPTRLALGESRPSFQLHPASGGLPFWEWLEQPAQRAQHAALTRAMQRLTARDIRVRKAQHGMAWQGSHDMAWPAAALPSALASQLQGGAQSTFH